MPNKKKKYNARFPPARIKKIMQTDEEVGKVAAAVPVIICAPRALELFVESLIRKTSDITLARNAKTLTPAHLKQCIAVESQFDFLKDVVASVPDVQGDDDSSNPPTGDTTPLPQSKLLINPLKRQRKFRRKFSRNNGDDGAGPSHAASSESEEESDEDEDEDDEDERVDDDYSSNKSTDFYDVSRTKHKLTNPLPNGQTSVIIKPQTSSLNCFPLVSSIQGMDEDYDS